MENISDICTSTWVKLVKQTKRKSRRYSQIPITLKGKTHTSFMKALPSLTIFASKMGSCDRCGPRKQSILKTSLLKSSKHCTGLGAFLLLIVKRRDPLAPLGTPTLGDNEKMHYRQNLLNEIFIKCGMIDLCADLHFDTIFSLFL